MSTRLHSNSSQETNVQKNSINPSVDTVLNLSKSHIETITEKALEAWELSRISEAATQLAAIVFTKPYFLPAITSLRGLMQVAPLQVFFTLRSSSPDHTLALVGEGDFGGQFTVWCLASVRDAASKDPYCMEWAWNFVNAIENPSLFGVARFLKGWFHFVAKKEVLRAN